MVSFTDAAIPQHDARRLLPAAITGGGQEPEASSLEVRYRQPGQPMRRTFFACRDLAGVSATAAMLAEGGHDVYVNTAPLTYRFGGADAIARKWVLAVDLDRDDALERLATFEPPPSIVITTGTNGNAHAYWPLLRPLEPGHAVIATRRLAYALEADMRATDAARILRLPGTWNFKHSPPAPVLCVRLELESFTAAQVVGHLPDPPERRLEPVPGRQAPGRRDSTDPLRGVPAEVYARALTGREPSRDHKIACPFHDDATPSMHLYGNGWACFACAPLREGRDHLGGDIYVFAGLLWGLDWRDRDQFLELRRRLAAELLPHVREAAA